MVDLELDQNGDVVFRNGDLATVEGRHEFEQRLREWVQDKYSDIIGNTTKLENTLDDIYVQARRVAQDFDHIDQIANITANRGEEPGTYEVGIDYQVDGESKYVPIILE